jgi:hypothetical protein
MSTETSLRIQAQNILFTTGFSPAAAAAVGHRLRSRLRCALPGCHGKGLAVNGTNIG